MEERGQSKCTVFLSSTFIWLKNPSFPRTPINFLWKPRASRHMVLKVLINTKLPRERTQKFDCSVSQRTWTLRTSFMHSIPLQSHSHAQTGLGKSTLAGSYLAFCPPTYLWFALYLFTLLPCVCNCVSASCRRGYTDELSL